MNSIDFIKSELRELVELIPYIKCIYEFDSFDSTHYIKILPREFYEIDDLYLSAEEKIINKFIKEYPYEGIVFITENDDIDIDKPIFEIKGMLFDIFSKSLLFNFADLEIFKNYIPQIQHYFKINLKLSENKSYNSLFNITIDFQKSNYIKFTSIREVKNSSPENFEVDIRYSSAA